METTDDHYRVLNITYSATTAEIKQAYKSLALKFHPDKNQSPQAGERFVKIQTAYSVLGDPNRRQSYDWKIAGAFQKPPFKTSGMECNMDVEMNDLFDGCKGLFDDIFSDVVKANYSTIRDETMYEFPFKKATPIDRPVENDLFLSLEEINTGTTKKLQITRKVILSDGTSNQEKKVLVINVEPGWQPGTRVTFEREGDQAPGIVPADVVFTIRDKKHKNFTRDAGNNLIYVCKVSLKDALLCRVINVPTLDGRTLRITHKEVIRPGFTQVVVGEGLPLANNPTRRANLIIQYEIIFPRDLSSAQKQGLIDSLPEI